MNQAVAQRKHRMEAAKKAADAQAQRAEARAQRAALGEARSRWVRAHDRKWLRQANLPDVARAWGAAAPYADDNASAAFAVRNCEERLRDLHPHAMSHYDRLRRYRKNRLDAMTLAAPFFTRDPNVRTGELATQRRELHEGTGSGGRRRFTVRIVPSGKRLGRSGERPRSSMSSEPSCASRATRPATTSCAQYSRSSPTCPRTSSPKPSRPTPEERPTRRSDSSLAAEDFPLTINEALEMSSKQPLEAPAARRDPSQVPDRNRRRNL